MSGKADGPMTKMILEDINMNERVLEEAVIHMKTWLQKQPHLPQSASDDLTLKAFIIGCKSVEKAKAKIDSYYTLRREFKIDYFQNRDPLAINYKSCYKIVLLPGITKEGYHVFLNITPSKQELTHFDPIVADKASFMLYDSFLREYHMSAGVYLLLDLANLSVEFTVKLGFKSATDGSKLIQEGYPIRLKGLIAFNAPPMSETFFNTLIRPFFNQKMKERITIHSSDSSCLEKYIPLEMLPRDYQGGKSPSIDELWEETKNRLERERVWLMTDGCDAVDESLRPQKDKDEMKGTFRQLHVE